MGTASNAPTRSFFPISPDYMEVSAWALAPVGESSQDRALRLDNFLTFLGPGGYATPDDVEMLEACQRGYAAFRDVEWSDISRGIKLARSRALLMSCKCRCSGAAGTRWSRVRDQGALLRDAPLNRANWLLS